MKASALRDHWDLMLVCALGLVGLCYAIYDTIDNRAQVAAYKTMRAELERCTLDCSGHRAGYAWAENNDVWSLDDCGGKSQSFINGCKTYVYERMADDYRPDDPDQSPY